MKKAFTLIELLTVIAIIGILAALITPIIGSMTNPGVTKTEIGQYNGTREKIVTDEGNVYFISAKTSRGVVPVQCSEYAYNNVQPGMNVEVEYTVGGFSHEDNEVHHGLLRE